MAEADIGLIGLAVMGRNLVLNINDHGFTAAVFNRTVAKVDAFLADSYSAAMPGGTGRTADWDRVRRFVKEAAPTPVILAGGLTPD